MTPGQWQLSHIVRAESFRGGCLIAKPSNALQTDYLQCQKKVQLEMSIPLEDLKYSKRVHYNVFSHLLEQTNALYLSDSIV